jgi:hypothetical protein
MLRIISQQYEAQLSFPAVERHCLASLLSEKIPQARQLSDMLLRQNRADQIRLRRGVNFIQVALRFGLLHEFLDAFV